MWGGGEKMNDTRSVPSTTHGGMTNSVCGVAWDVVLSEKERIRNQALCKFTCGLKGIDDELGGESARGDLDIHVEELINVCTKHQHVKLSGASGLWHRLIPVIHGNN